MVRAENAGVRLRESEDQKRHIDVGIFAEGGYAYVNRAATNQPDKSNTYVESKAPYDVSKQKAHLKILVDKTTIEVFVGDGKTVFQMKYSQNLKIRALLFILTAAQPHSKI